RSSTSIPLSPFPAHRSSSSSVLPARPFSSSASTSPWCLRRSGALALTASTVTASNPFVAAVDAARHCVAQPEAPPPPCDSQRAALVGSTPEDPLDVLVVGGGATRCGAARLCRPHPAAAPTSSLSSAPPRRFGGFRRCTSSARELKFSAYLAYGR
ncbi:unnamed protein product, partial [Urochloa humidicola]